MPPEYATDSPAAPKRQRLTSAIVNGVILARLYSGLKFFLCILHCDYRGTKGNCQVANDTLLFSAFHVDDWLGRYLGPALGIAHRYYKYYCVANNLDYSNL
jgi:hypothetical protein